MKATHVSSIIGTCLLAALPLTGCAQAVDHTLAGDIKSQLPKAIGPAADYDVSVSSDPIQVAEGKIREVDIAGDDVNLSPTLLVSHLQVQAHDITVNTSSHKLKSVGAVAFQADIGQDSIDHYLYMLPEDSTQKKQELSVTLNDSSVTASLKVNWLGVKVPVTVTGEFLVDPDNDTQILFEPSKGSLSIIPIPVFAMRLAMKNINPVIDLSTSTVPVDLSSVSIQDGYLDITGAADLNSTLAQNSQ